MGASTCGRAALSTVLARSSLDAGCHPSGIDPPRRRGVGAAGGGVLCATGAAPRVAELRRRQRPALPRRAAGECRLCRTEEAGHRHRREPETRARRDCPRATPGGSARHALRQHSVARQTGPEDRPGGAVPRADSRQRRREGVRPLRARRRTHGRNGRVLPHQPEPLVAESGDRRNGEIRLPRPEVRALEALHPRVPRAAAARSFAENRRVNGGET